MTTTPLGPGERAPARTDAPVDTVAARPRDEGPAAVALLASGVGAFALGLFTTLAEVSTSFKDALVITEPVGPLSGKTTYAVAIWLVTWAVLHVALGRRVRLSPAVLTVTVVLLGLGLLGTFPIFFEAFAAE
jgi:hypothetical protein